MIARTLISIVMVFFFLKTGKDFCKVFRENVIHCEIGACYIVIEISHTCTPEICTATDICTKCLFNHHKCFQMV